MYDKIENVYDSTIQHGKLNDRIYLMKIGTGDISALIKKIETLAKEKDYTKIFAKIPAPLKKAFECRGYKEEANVPGFYNGEIDVFFMAKFYSLERSREKDPETVTAVLEKTRSKTPLIEPPLLLPGFRFAPAKDTDAKKISEVFKVVFKTYPFPIHDPSYILKTMRKNLAYFCMWSGEDLAAVSSSEMDEAGGNVEMTDFATLPDFRGNKIALYMLSQMERDMKRRGFKTSYTIARALSFGMNITFAKLGYKYTGTLVNNTNISGKIESMNVWHKPL